VIFTKEQQIKWLLFSLGIIILSFGISLTIWAAVMGVSSWDSLHLGLTNYLPLNYGQICQLVGAVAILFGMVLGVKPKLGTLLNMLLVGWIVNFFLGFYPPEMLMELNVLTVIVFMLGVALSGIGSGMYITAGAGIGPRDSIMVGLNQKFGIRIGWARTILEVLVVCLGFLLSGPIGIGTIIFSVTIGFFVEKTLLTLNKWQVLQPQVDKA